MLKTPRHAALRAEIPMAGYMPRQKGASILAPSHRGSMLTGQNKDRDKLLSSCNESFVDFS
jgi:hypothetical protein